MVYISAMVLRKKIPAEEYKFKIPGGFGFLVADMHRSYLRGMFAFFINGSDYYLGGMIGMISGPILYVIWRKMYGGLTKKDPVSISAQSRRQVLELEIRREMAFLFLLMTVMNVYSMCIRALV